MIGGSQLVTVNLQDEISMRYVGFGELVNFVVDCRLPMASPLLGVEAISGGYWHRNATEKFSDVDGFKVLSGTLEEISLLTKIFSELYRGSSIPMFRSFMPSDEYKEFVLAYLSFVTSRADDYWGAGGRGSALIFDKHPAYGFMTCWVPFPRSTVEQDLIFGMRDDLRRTTCESLKRMCLDIGLLKPYFQGAEDSCEKGRLQVEGAWLFLGLMGVALLKNPNDFLTSGSDLKSKVMIPRFNKEGWVFHSARQKVLDCLQNNNLIVVESKKFRKLFGVVHVGGELMYGESNSKGWYVMPWWNIDDGDGTYDSNLSAGFRNKNCSQIFHNAIQDLWRNNEEIPTETILRNFWFSKMEGRSGYGDVKRDPGNLNKLMFFDVGNGIFISEDKLDFNDLIGRFVRLDGF